MVSATDDILYYDGAVQSTWTLPSTVPVGKIYYIINQSSTFDNVLFSNTIVTTGHNLADPTAANMLIHVGSGDYAIVSGF
jgi:hypothetical protein